MEKYCNMGKKRTVESLQLSTKSPIFVTKNITAMIHTGERYINPLTDFGFKRIFGTPFNKDLIHQSVDRLWFQAHLRHPFQQGLADELPQCAVQW